jgi:hypothetical protein
MVAVGVSVDAADNERLLVHHPVPAVLSIREGGPVGKGGHNSDEALVASRFLSGHAPPDPTALWAIYGGQPGADRSPRTTPHGVSLCAGQTPTRPPDPIFTVCATASVTSERPAPCPPDACSGLRLSRKAARSAGSGSGGRNEANFGLCRSAVPSIPRFAGSIYGGVPQVVDGRNLGAVCATAATSGRSIASAAAHARSPVAVAGAGGGSALGDRPLQACREPRPRRLLPRASPQAVFVLVRQVAAREGACSYSSWRRSHMTCSRAASPSLRPIGVRSSRP